MLIFRVRESTGATNDFHLSIPGLCWFKGLMTHNGTEPLISYCLFFTCVLYPFEGNKHKVSARHNQNKKILQVSELTTGRFQSWD